MPLPRGSVDLILSRGALWFWDKEQSLREIWRVLAPGGAALVGGGYGSYELKEAIYRKMSRINGEDWNIRRKKTTGGSSPEDYALVLDRMGLPCYRVIHEGSGDWLLVRKPREAEALSWGAPFPVPEDPPPLPRPQVQQNAP
jgi:SAM-dependent methyltransferase